MLYPHEVGGANVPWGTQHGVRGYSADDALLRTAAEHPETAGKSAAELKSAPFFAHACEEINSSSGYCGYGNY